MESKEIIKILDTYFLDKIKQVNLYMLPQYTLLIMMYYLVLNSLLDLYDLFAAKLGAKPIDDHLPNIVVKYNNSIMDTLVEWNSLFLVLSISLLISGIVIQSTRQVVLFRNYNVFRRHSSYGYDVFIWLFLMWLSYKLYSFSDVLFPLCFIAISLLSTLWNKVAKKLKDVGITFE